MKKYLAEVAEKTSIILSEEMLIKFEKFYFMLLDRNKSMNLTSITEEKEVVLKHFLDSIYLSKFINLSFQKIIDIGTGAGFPGIPLAILYPETKFILVDSLQKRLHFINDVKENCKLKNIETVHGRAEDLGQNNLYREQFDYCLSRAVAALPVLLELCTPFIKVGGSFISYKSELAEEEIKQSAHALSVLHCKLENEHSYTLPDSNYYRVYVIFQKNALLEKKYPRKAGKLQKKPL